jgi:hypothetical protein
MQFRISWPNHTHFLLAGANVELLLNGAAVTLTQIAGGAEATLPSAAEQEALLTVEFKPNLTGTPRQVLRIRQRFKLNPASFSVVQPGGAQPSEYLVVPTGSGTDVAQTGLHPLLHSFSDGMAESWRVKVDTSVVDITDLQPLLLGRVLALRTKGRTANLRFLARTDGKLPLHYICATPPECSTAVATDVLCFLTPPQDSGPDLDGDEMLLNPAKIERLAQGAGIFLGTGKHDNKLVPRARDHFTPSKPKPNVVLPRRWEEALMDSGKHVSLVLPVPANGSHNTAATGSLPLQLRQVHATLLAIGDIAAPANLAPGAPLLGAAAHSFAGFSLFEALKLSAKEAFREIWMFDALGSTPNVSTVARTVGANVLYAGWSRSYVEETIKAALKIPALASRVRRLPDPAPVPKASPAALIASSPLLAHMLEEIVTPGKGWEPKVIPQPQGPAFDERFEVLHQQIVQGNDADGVLFLTKALKGSAFR